MLVFVLTRYGERFGKYAKKSMAQSISLPLDEVIKQLEEEFDDLEAEYQGVELAEDEEDERSLQEDEQHAQDDDYRSNCTEEEVSEQRENSVASHEEIGVDSSFEDLEEKAAVQRFVSDTCKCQLGPAKTACSQQLSRRTIESTRNNCHQMTRQQLDLVIMSQVNALRTSKEDIPSTYKENPDSFRPYTMFYIHGIKICQTAFLFLHTIGKDRLKRLSNSVDMHGVAERVHGNVKRVPSHTCKPEQIKEVHEFIENIAETHALPLPGRLPNHKDRAMLLPSDMPKSRVYRDYVKACEMKNSAPVGRTKFYTLWKATLPHIDIMKPASDLCFDCQQLMSAIAKSGHLPEDEKTERLRKAEAHLKLAKSERDLYNKQIALCRERLNDISLRGDEDRHTGPIHVSYDFAQQLHYPNNPQQPGPAYFLTSRKCQLFGVTCEALARQTNYLIDEADVVGKGANATISLLHHTLEQSDLKTEQLLLHADNCVGQNKNNATIHYLIWRVMSGRQKSIQLSFMLAGHTKFAPDRFFGLIKKVYRRTRVDTMQCLVRVVNNSTVTNGNIAQPVRSSTGEQLVKFFRWNEYLSDFFSTIPNITKYHIFRVHQEHPGVVFIREYSESEEIAINVLKVQPPSSFNSLPEEIQPKGLDPQRQWYLYERIRPFCSSTLAADLTCPKPSTYVQA